MPNQIKEREMANSNGERKKGRLSLFWLVLKWLGISLVALLLIASVVFQAPWKVITLFTVIFLACTALPKPYRKYFWLTAAGVVIVLIIWVFLPEDNQGWRPYKFEEEIAALEAELAVPDVENAALIYNQILEIWQAEDENEPNLPDDYYGVTTSGPWSREDYPEIAEWLDYQKPIIDKLLEASKYEKCLFPIAADMIAFDETMGRLSPIRQWAYLLIAAANRDLAEEKVNDAFEKYCAVLQMSKHMYQQPTLIEMLVGMAIEAMAVVQFNRFVVSGDATEEHLSVTEKALVDIKNDWNCDLPKILDHEKLLIKNLCSIFYEVNLEGTTRLSHDLWAVPRAYMEEQIKSNRIEDKEIIERLNSTYLQRKLVKAAIILGWFFIPSTPQKAGEIIDESYEKYYEMAKTNFNWQQGPQKSFLLQAKYNFWQIRFNFRYFAELLTSASAEGYYSIHDLYLRLMADRRGSRLLIALRQYKNKTGYWPENLDEIRTLVPEECFVDPLNNGSFVYKLADENFILYSKGENGIDDEGRNKNNMDDWLIWPKKLPKTDEEKADAEQ